MPSLISRTGRPQGRAAALHQGRAQQPTRQPTGRAAALHQGRPAPPPAPTGRSAALVTGGRTASTSKTRIYFVGGAGLDTSGWHYTQRWATAFRQAGTQEFIPITNVSHDAAGSFPLNDILFTTGFRVFTHESVPTKYNVRRIPITWGRQIKTDLMINKAVNRIVDDFHKSPLKATDQLVLIGYSYGSVLQSHVALKLHRMGYHVTMLILVGSPVPTNSQLYQVLAKVTRIKRIDIPGDKLSNPTSPWQYFEGAQQNSSDDGPHFDLARPGATADRKIKETARKIENLLNRHGR